METLYQSKYFQVFFERANKLFFFRFLKSTSYMTPVEYYEELTAYIRLLREYKPQGAWGDMSDFMYHIEPETQEWMDKHIFKVYKQIGFKKIALILGNQYIVNLSIQQTIEEDTTGAFKTACFKQETEALDWLLDSSKLVYA